MGRRIFSLACITALIVTLGICSAWAAFSSLETDPNTAYVDLSGTQTYSWTVTVHNVSDDVATSNLGWSDVTSGEDIWKVSDQYIKIDASVTYTDWGIQIYTDNKDAAASPQYTGTAGSGYNFVGVSNTTSALPFAWKVVDVSTAAPVAPVVRSDYTGFEDYCWKWMKDKTQTTNPFLDDETYVRVWADDGIYWHESPTEPGNPGAAPSPNYVYIATWFDSSTAQVYSTNRLILEIYSL